MGDWTPRSENPRAWAARFPRCVAVLCSNDLAAMARTGITGLAPFPPRRAKAGPRWRVTDVLRGERRCARCQSRKPLAAFPRQRGQPQGRGYWCLACCAAAEGARSRARKAAFGG